MTPRSVVALVVAPALVLGAAVLAGQWASGRSDDARSSLASALGALPADTQVAGFTDWSAIRGRLDLDAGTTVATRAALNDDASLRDLSTRSVIGRSVEEMHQAYGWSAADLDWEVFGQAADGAAMVARLDESVSLDRVRAALRSLDYDLDDGVWSTTDSTPVSGELAETLASITVIADQRLVVASSRPAYVMTVREVIDRRQSSLLGVRPVTQIAAELAGSDTALIQGGAVACAAASFEKQPADVLAQAGAAVTRVGALEAMTYAGRALTDRSADLQEVRFALGFASPAQAVDQLQTRIALASGPAIGGSGRVEDSLRLTSSRVTGATASLRFDHDPTTATYMGGTGPLLFASCPR